MQPQGGSSCAPPQSGCGVPPRGSNLNANVPPYCPIPRQSGRGIPPRDSSLPVATVPPHSPIPVQVEEVPLPELFDDARDEAKRRQALSQLVKRMKSVPDMSLLIWIRPWMVDLIMSEIRRIHPYIERQEEISEDYFDRAYSAITLLHTLVKDKSSRDYFLQALWIEDLYPFLKNPMESKTFNYLRIASLGVIFYVVQESDIQAVEHHLQSDIVTLCIRWMKVHGCELKIAIAVGILEKILTTEIGLASICDDQERYLEIIHLLASMFNRPHTSPITLKLFQRVVSCFYLFSHNPSVSKSLHKYLPDTFKDGSFRRLFRRDNKTLDRVYQVIWNAYMS